MIVVVSVWANQPERYFEIIISGQKDAHCAISIEVMQVCLN